MVLDRSSNKSFFPKARSGEQRTRRQNKEPLESGNAIVNGIENRTYETLPGHAI